MSAPPDPPVVPALERFAVRDQYGIRAWFTYEADALIWATEFSPPLTVVDGVTGKTGIPAPFPQPHENGPGAAPVVGIALEQVRRLIDRWRADARVAKSAGYHESWNTREACADALADLLAGAAPVVPALEQFRELIEEEIEAQSGNDPQINYCWWCKQNVNGAAGSPQQPHRDDCWLVRARRVLGGGAAPVVGIAHPPEKDPNEAHGSAHAPPHQCNSTYRSVTKVAMNVSLPDPEVLARLNTRVCVRCGYPASAHLHLFGSTNYLFPILSMFKPPDTNDRTCLDADSAVDLGASNAGKESLRADPSDLQTETGVVGIAPPSPPDWEVERTALLARIDTLKTALDKKMDLAVEAELAIRRSTVEEHLRLARPPQDAAE